MKDCRIELELKDGEVKLKAEHAGVVEMAVMCGALQQFTGLAAYRAGQPLDEMKTYLLDIHLSAMETLTAQTRKEDRNEG